MPSSAYVRNLCIIGISLSCYAMHVEHRMSLPEAHEFIALCDIPSLGASCSKTLTLPEGKCKKVNNKFHGFKNEKLVS